MAQYNSSRGQNRSDDFSFEIVNHFGVISTSNHGWTKEFNLVSWNRREPKYDIREWKPDHSKMSKGVTMTAEEVRELSRLIQDLVDEPADDMNEGDKSQAA